MSRQGGSLSHFITLDHQSDFLRYGARRILRLREHKAKRNTRHFLETNMKKAMFVAIAVLFSGSAYAAAPEAVAKAAAACCEALACCVEGADCCP